MDGTHTGAHAIRWPWIAVMWCVGGLFEASQAVLIMRFAEGRRHAWLPLFATQLATWLPWALATPWVISLARRYPIIRATGLRTLAVHLLAFATISAVAEAWSATLQVLFNPWGKRQPPMFWDTWSTTTLAEEVEYLQRYLDLQKLRFGERLRVSVEIPADLLDTQVPNLLLQPLVENAIKHGVAKRVAGGTVRVIGARGDDNFYLSVYNDGPGFPDDWQSNGRGVGLANLRTRLQILHGESAELQMRRAGADGVEVAVILPLMEA